MDPQLKIEAKAREHFDSGYYCAESVLLAIAEQLDFNSSLIPAVATGFCSGISRTCGICGAVSGGIMALGAVFGRSRPQQTEEPCYSRVQEFVYRFTEMFGSANCRDLTGCDLGTEAGRIQFQEENIRDKCSEFTGEAARLALSLIESPGR